MRRRVASIVVRVTDRRNHKPPRQASAEIPLVHRTVVNEIARAHAERLVGVQGVVGVMIGGSHARQTADASSDLDLGVYYREPLDLDAMRKLASDCAGRPTEVAGPGGWGPGGNGGAWLDLPDGRVDWILRDLDRVRSEWGRAQAGEFSVHHQPGHPFGFVSTTYVAELALGVIVADPSGELHELQAATATYPHPLREAFDRWLWEAGFSIDIASKPAGRGDAAYVDMCLTHAVGIIVYALHAREGRWVTNEKGIVASAAQLSCAPEGFAVRVHEVIAGGATPADLEAKLEAARALLRDVRGPE